MKELAIIIILNVCIFSILIYLIKVLKRQKAIRKNITYRSQFMSKEPHAVVLLSFLWLLVCAGFLRFILLPNNFSINLFIEIIKEKPLLDQIVSVSFCSALCFGVIYFTGDILGHFNLYIKVDNDNITIRNKYRKVYEIHTSQIEAIRIGSKRRGDDCSIALYFLEVNNKKYCFSMILYWEEFLLMREWVKLKKIQEK